MTSAIPKFAWLVTAAAVLSLLLVCTVAWRVDLLGHEEEARACQRSVQYRDDNRTMWLYLLESATDASEKELEAFRKELNKRLPALECRDDNPVPK